MVSRDVRTTKMADLFAKYNCTYCQEDITGLRIKCAECPDFDLCLQCFSAGAEIGIHKNDHSYQFMDSGSVGVCLGQGGWSVREEVHLLDAIEQYGFGNWEDISRHIETRTPEEAKEEYIARFIEGSIGRLTWPAAINTRPNLIDHTNADNGPLSPALTTRLPPPDSTREESTLLGYMPLRDDFEREFDNGAESLVSPLYVNNIEDDDLDINLKLAQVDMYTRRLRDRARRKRVARDYQLIAQFFSATRKDKPFSKKKLTKEQRKNEVVTRVGKISGSCPEILDPLFPTREFQDRLRVFTSFHTAQEHEQFLHGLFQKQDLKFRLQELIRYRRNGLTSQEECIHFEQERLQHDHWKEKKSGSSGFNLSSPSMDQRKRVERKEPYSILGNPFQNRNIFSNTDNSGTRIERGGTNPSDLSSFPNCHLLTPHEVKLCESLQLKPMQYLSWKAILLNDHLQNGLKKEDLDPQTNLGPEKQILDYLVSSGWIAVN